jgi:hypothetical protein
VFGQAKTAVVSNSDPATSFGPIDPTADPVDPATVGPISPTAQSLAAKNVLGDQIDPAAPATTGGRRGMAAIIVPGVRMAIGVGTTITNITGTMIGTIIGRTTTSTIITMIGITALGAATGRATGTCQRSLGSARGDSVL